MLASLTTGFRLIRADWRPGIGAVLLGIAFLLSGCQQKMVPATTVTVEEPAIEDQENGQQASCAYFYFLWGRSAELDLHFAEALEAYEKALVCDPGADYVNRKIPVLLIRLDRTQEAVSWLNRYLKKHPDDAGLRLLLAKILVQQKQYAQAAREYRRSYERHPKDITPLLLLADLYLLQKRHDQARKTLEEVLRRQPASYPAHLFLARLLRDQGDYSGALAHYRRALTENWSIDLEFEISDLHLQQHHYREAAQVYQEILKQDEDNEEARLGMVHVYLLQHQEDKALAQLEKLRAVSNHPNRVDLSMARLYTRQEQFDKAAAILNKVLKRGEDVEARWLLALVFVQQERDKEALEQLEKIPSSSRIYGEALLMRVRVLRALDREQEAIALLQKAVADAHIRRPAMYILLAALYENSGEPEKGEQVLRQALERYPDSSELLYEFGLYLDRVGKQDQAMATMRQVIARDPANAGALNYVGYTWADKKQHLDRALEYIQRAVQLKPENGYIRDSLGWIYFRLGKIPEAIEALKKALDLAPNDPAILEHLGDVYLAAGKPQQALFQYTKALSFYRHDPEKKAVQEKIRILREQETP